MNLTRGRPSGSVTSDVRVTTPEGYTLDLVSATDDARQVLTVERARRSPRIDRVVAVVRQRELYQQAATQALAARFAHNTVNLALEVVGRS